MDAAGFGTATGRRSTVTKGEDLRYDITLEFSAAIFGAEKEFELSHLETCEVCAGDLFVYLDIEEIPEIQRDGINLMSTISVSYLDAILGTVVKVKTVEGTTELQIPPGTQPSDVLVLARKGAPKLNKPSIRGDHLFTIKVSIPKRVSAKERELLEELASLNGSPIARTKTQPKVQQAARSTETKIDSDSGTEKSDESEDTDDVWKKLKDFAG
nr:Chaperone protein DnaJ [Ipomoea batatas]